MPSRGNQERYIVHYKKTVDGPEYKVGVYASDKHQVHMWFANKYRKQRRWFIVLVEKG